MFACIYVFDFSVKAIVRAEPLLREQAVAVLDGRPPLVRVIALNEKARLLGMEVNMTKLQAAVFAAPQERDTAILRQRSLQQENSAHSALLDVAHAFTPRVEDTAPDTLLLDLTGMERLYGAPAKMARKLATQVSLMGMESNVALAGNPDAAMHAARGFCGVTVIPAGKEAQRLGVLPLAVLLGAFELSLDMNSAAGRDRGKLHEQLLDTLERWGVHDFRTLALLPEHALASRLGEAGTRLQRLACGEGMRTLALCEPPSRFEEAMELESPVGTLEPLSFVLNRLLERLCARLEARALAAQELHLRLQLEQRVADEETTTAQELADSSDNVTHAFERTLRLPVTMSDAKVFLKLLQLELAAHPPGAPVIKIWITAEPAPPRSAQCGLFLPTSLEPEKLEITLARISGVVGERRAGIAQLLDSHQQDSFRIDRFVAAAEESKPVRRPTLSDSDSEPAAGVANFSSSVAASGAAVRRATGQFDYYRETNRSQRSTRKYLVVGRTLALFRRLVDGKHQRKRNQNWQGAWDREEWDIALAITRRN